MQHLQELGLELKETMLYWARCVDNNPRAATHYGKWVLIKGNNAQTVGLMHWEFIPAYTLQDVMDALPTTILHDKRIYELDINMCNESIEYVKTSVDDVLVGLRFTQLLLIDAQNNKFQGNKFYYLYLIVYPCLTHILCDTRFRDSYTMIKN